MKTRPRNPILASALAVGLGMMLTGGLTAQTFTVLHNFAGTNVGQVTVSNSDGAFPHAALTLSGNTLYGTTFSGGSSGNGALFKLNTDGTGFSNLHIFSATTQTNSSGLYTNTDGANPNAGLVISGNTLYGAAVTGGSFGYGTLFSLNTNGTGFTVIYNFANSDGSGPWGDLILSGNTLYGTTRYGGSFGAGTVFSVNADGSGFENLDDFAGGSNGGYPLGRLVLSNTTLFGTAAYANDYSPGYGSVFKLDTSGIAYPNLHNFSVVATPPGPQPSPNSDGANPVAGLVLLGENLYGTTQNGGTGGSGEVFRMDVNGFGFTNFYCFSYIGFVYFNTNLDGGEPAAGLTLSGNTFYGATMHGGSGTTGTLFKMNTDGSGFASLYNFTQLSQNLSLSNSDGGIPMGTLVLAGNTLYGAASAGGIAGTGTIFSLALPPISPPYLNSARFGTNLVLSWPTNPVFSLQATTNLGPTASWSAVSPPPVPVNGQNIVTNPIIGSQKYYRLSQ